MGKLSQGHGVRHRPIRPGRDGAWDPEWRPPGWRPSVPRGRELGVSGRGLGARGEGQDPDVGGCQRKKDPDVGAPRSPDPGRTSFLRVQPRARDRGCARRRGRGSLTIRGSWRRRRPARSLPVGSAPPPVPRWWPLRPRGPARNAQAQTRPTRAAPQSSLGLVVSCPCASHRLPLRRRQGKFFFPLFPPPHPIGHASLATHCFLGLVVRCPGIRGFEGVLLPVGSLVWD